MATSTDQDLPLPTLPAVHRLATVAWLLPFLVAVWLVAWGCFDPDGPPRRRTLLAGADGILAVMAGGALLAGCIPYLILSSCVRARQRWAPIALAAVAGLHGAVQLYPVVQLGRFIYGGVLHGEPAAPRDLFWFLLTAALPGWRSR